MSSLTICNYCSLQAINERALRRGETVRTERNVDGWIEVYVSDKEEPVAYLMELTTDCAC